MFVINIRLPFCSFCFSLLLVAFTIYMHIFLTVNIRPSRYVTVGDRSFATAGPRLWNSLPADVRSASSLTTFRGKLKTH